MDLNALGYDQTRLEDLGYSEEELDDLTQAYIFQMTSANEKEVEEVWQREGIIYSGVREHERSEVAAHLLDGYSEEEILNGTAKREDHDRAHEAALLSEHSFYQQLGKDKLGEEIPLKAFMLVHPLNITGEVLRLGGYLDDLEEMREEIEGQEVTGTDLFYAMNTFEDPEHGLSYNNFQQTFNLAMGYLEGETEDEFGEFEERPLMDVELPWGV